MNADITEDEGYQEFVESMVPFCRCASAFKPCDGVLAGGLCDELKAEDFEEYEWGE